MSNLLDSIVQWPFSGLLRRSNSIPVPWNWADALRGTMFWACGILIGLTIMSFLSDTNGPIFNNRMIAIITIFTPIVMIVSVWLFGPKRNRTKCNSTVRLGNT